MNYYVFKFILENEHYDLLTGLLSTLDFEAVEEREDVYLVYFQLDEPEDDFIASIDRFNDLIDFSYSYEKVENKNWNEEWEANFKPIVIDDFVSIRADFHPQNNEVLHDLIINPKMAFGTGHHETTEMMMRFMQEMNLENKAVFDFGCGTGLLAILAKKLNCAFCLAVDYDINSVTNSQENIILNDTADVIVKEGSFEKAEENLFDVILANINRSVLTHYVQDFSKQMSQNGILLISGFLKTEIQMMKEMFEKYGFTELETKQKGEWACMKLKCL